MSAKDQDTEISLKEALLAVKEYLFEIKRCIPIILLITLPIVGYQFYKSYTADWYYYAPLTFMLNEGSGNSAGISSILGSMGLPVGKSDENFEKIIELAKSRRIASATVFTKVVIGEKEDYLANHIIEMLENYGKWNPKGLFGGKVIYKIDGLRFTHDSIPGFTLDEGYALQHLQEHLNGNSFRKIDPLFYPGYDENTGIMLLDAITFHPDISLHLSNIMFKELSEYYIEQATEKQEINFDLIKAKSDSIYGELQTKNYSLANFKDKNQGMFARADKLTESKLMLEIQKLTAMYAEATKNLEVADFALKNKTPYIQLVDGPMLPILPQKLSVPRSIAIGLFLGAFFGVAFVVTRKMFRDVLS